MRSSIGVGDRLGSTNRPLGNDYGHTGSPPAQQAYNPLTSHNPAFPHSEELEKLQDADLKPPSKREDKVRWRDLPNKSQLFILSLCRLSEPLSNVCLLPYIFYLVRSVLDPVEHENAKDTSPSAGPVGTGKGEADALAVKISLVSGLLVAAFPVAQMVVSLPWGRLSDSHGRRPSILLGLLLTVIANLCFGLSRSTAGLFIWRCIAGAANGNVALMRTMTAETVKERKYQTRAFLLLPLVFNSGTVASLALGGMLAEPVKGIPAVFGEGAILGRMGEWLDDHPYSLPSILNAVALGTVLVIATLGLKETLPGMEERQDWGLKSGDALLKGAGRIFCGRRKGYERLGSEGGDEENAGPVPLTPSTPSSAGTTPTSVRFSLPSTPTTKSKQPPLRSLLTPKLTASLVSFALLPLHNSAFMHLFPLYLSTPPSEANSSTAAKFTGGLGLPASTIGPWLGMFGVAGILLQLFIYPRLQAWLGTLGLFRWSTIVFPLAYLVIPFLSLMSTHSPSQYGLLAVVSALQILARTVAIPSTVILLTEAAPEKKVLGTVHGAGNMMASAARAVGPALGGAVFAVGVRIGIIGLVWWTYLMVVAVLAAGWAWGMQKGEDEKEGKRAS